MKKLITLTAIILCTFGALFAETAENRKENPHEIRIGIADSYMEACMENSAINAPNFKNEIAEGPFYKYGNLNHTGHIFIEYQHRINSWFSAGINADYLHSWYHLRHNKTQNVITNSNFKISLIPTLRFTYFHHKMVDLYSSFGIGLNYTYYNSQEYRYIDQIISGIFDVSLLGISVGKNHWFGTFELGGTTSIAIIPLIVKDGSPRKGRHEFMPIPFARLLRISVGYRF